MRSSRWERLTFVPAVRLVVGLLPFGALAALILAARAGAVNGASGTLVGVLAWALLLTASTEILSLAHAIAPAALGCLWAATTLLAGIAWRNRRRTAARPVSADSDRRQLVISPSVVGIVVLLAGTLATALLAMPNSADSMTYHLGRVEHWAQNRSVGHFPTTIARQLHSMPFAEMVVLHARVLSGGERLANLPAWLAFAGCVWLSGSLGTRLSGRRAAGLSAALFAATVPMAVLQASSTLNDLVTAFFLLATAELVFVPRGSRPAPAESALIGGAVGLALLTKGTAYLYAPPLAAAFIIRTLGTRGRGAIASLGIAAAVAGLVNAGHWWRNASVFGAPLVSGQTAMSLGDLGPRSFASNALRALALDLATPSPAVNARIVHAIVAAHRPLGISPSHPATTFAGRQFRTSERMLHENHASYPLHLPLLVAAMALLVLQRRLKARSDLIRYAAAVVAGAFLFTLLLRWQPWLTRLQLPGFLLAAPIAGAALVALPGLVAGALRMALIAVGLVALVANETRPLLTARARETLGLGIAGASSAPADPVWAADRTEQLFAAAPQWAESYRRVVGWLISQRARHVGLVARGGNAWEYPLWALLRDATPSPPEIRHVCVRRGAALAPPWHPEHVVVIEREVPDTLRCDGAEYVAALKAPPLTGYTRVHDPPSR